MKIINLKKIAIIADPIDNQNAGVHVYTKGMLLSLLREDNENEYIFFREKKDTLFGEFINCKEIVIPNFIGFTAIRKFIIIPILAIFYKVNMVIEPAHFGPFFLPKKIKRVTVIHDLSAILFPQWHNYYSSVLQKIFLKRILKNADIIISNSYFTENEIIKYFPFTTNKIQTIYPGVEQKIADEETIMDMETKPFLLYVGTIEPRKNLNLLLEAFELYKDHTQSNMQLFIVGAKGWKTESFFQKYHQHKYKNDIQILGFVSIAALNQYYENCEAFIYPSQYEGFGFPVIEAMLHGATCITTAKSSMSEISYPYAIYFNNNDAKSLFQAINEVPNFKNVNTKDEIIKHATKFNWCIFAKTLKQTLISI